jgi:transcriptional regulator with XRE-family HTH domain
MASRSPAHLALGAAIRRSRQEHGLSQEQLGLESGFDRTHIGGIEYGERNPSCTRLLTIAASLEIPLSEIIASTEKAQANMCGYISLA